MAKSLLDKLLDNIFDDQFKGKFGEVLTEGELKLVNLFGRKGKTLRNIYLPADDGKTSEVDVIYITQKGIFIFESKNYSGWIFGDEKSKNWTAMLPNREKHQFYNPIMQNRTHLKWMKKFAGDDVPLFSIIVFSDRCELKKVTVNSDNVKVIKRERTYATVRDIWERNVDAVSEERIEELYCKLKGLTNVSDAVKKAHVENIEKAYKSKTENNDVSDQISQVMSDSGDVNINENVEEKQAELICPKCGKALVLRIARKGSNAGNSFYGCSGFPGCRYIKNVCKSAQRGTREFLD